MSTEDIELAIIFIYTTDNEITKANLESIRANHPNTPVYNICQADFDDYHYSFLDLRPLKYWIGHEIWFWGSDNIFLYWYLSQNIRAKNYIIFEWDTYAHNCSIYDLYGKENIENNTGIISAQYAQAEKDPWYYWFQFQKDNIFLEKKYTPKHFCCSTPLCGTLITDECVSAIIEHIKTYPFINKIYVETKFSTIASFLGFSVTDLPNMNKYISFDSNICLDHIKELSRTQRSPKGIFHPVKDTNIIQEYFMSNEPETVRLKRAYYGIVADATVAIQTLIDMGIDTIVVNNAIVGDPILGANKSMYLEYEKDGQLYTKIIPEKGAIKLADL